MAVKVDIEKCIGCGICADVCPVNVIKMENKKAHIYEEFCTDCGLCINKCPTGALILENINAGRFDSQENHEHIPYIGTGRDRASGRGQGQGSGSGRVRGYGMGRRMSDEGSINKPFKDGIQKIISKEDELLELRKQVQELQQQLDMLLKRIADIKNNEK